MAVEGLDFSGVVDVASAARAFPRPKDVQLRYGVAGFRTRASLLDSTLLRMGMLAAARSRTLGLAVGLVVTASHNAEPDNGVKLVDPDGGMLAQSWEAHCEALANAPDDQVATVLAGIGGSADAAASAQPAPRVFLAWDTRPSSERLAALASRGAELCGAQVSSFGVLTTPQLHHAVRMANGEAAAGRFWGRPEWCGEAGYFRMLAGAYAELLRADASSPAAPPTPLHVDGACGVGALKIAPLAEALREALGAEHEREGAHGGGGGHSDAAPELIVVNRPGEGALNAGCGAEHVQKSRTPPRSLDTAAALEPGGRACSLDGDADRVVFHTYGEAGQWRLLDGDKMAALLASFLREQLARAGLLGTSTPPAADADAPTMAVVQTAYANGASSAYLRSQGVHIAVAKTGVKFLHHCALAFDLAVYFEANGHGTVLFSERLLERLTRVAAAGAGGASADRDASARAAAARTLLAAHRLINQVCARWLWAHTAARPRAEPSPPLTRPAPRAAQAVGDALSDMLAVDAVLRRLRWGVGAWDALYEDLPSRQTKLPVADRTVRARRARPRATRAWARVAGVLRAALAPPSHPTACARACGRRWSSAARTRRAYSPRLHSGPSSSG